MNHLLGTAGENLSRAEVIWAIFKYRYRKLLHTAKLGDVPPELRCVNVAFILIAEVETRVVLYPAVPNSNQCVGVCGKPPCSKRHWRGCPCFLQSGLRESYNRFLIVQRIFAKQMAAIWNVEVRDMRDPLGMGMDLNVVSAGGDTADNLFQRFRPHFRDSGEEA